MDLHHIAHYGIAAALAGGLAFVSVHSAPAIKGAYAPLTSSEEATLGAAIAATNVPALTVYCIDRKCEAVADSVVEAAESAHVEAKFEVSVVAPDGVSVGAKDPETAKALAKVVYEGSQHALEPRISVEPSTVAFVSFGKPGK